MSKKDRSDEKPGNVIDGETGLVEPTPPNVGAFGKDGRRIDLSTLRDIRLELARLYRRMDAEEVTAAEGSRRAFVLRQIHDCIVSSELERRIDDLEQRQGLPGAGRLLPKHTEH